MTGYRFDVCCPRCGGDPTHVTSGTPGLDTRAVTRCETCRIDYQLVLQLRDVTADIARPHDWMATAARRRRARRREAAP